MSATETNGSWLVGETLRAADQPTNEGPDMGNDMLVVLTSDNKVAIGDPHPDGTVIGQFIPVDADHGYIEFDRLYDPVELRADLARDQATIRHLMESVRWDVKAFHDLLFADEVTGVQKYQAVLELLACANGACDICETMRMPHESERERLAWLVERLRIKLAASTVLASCIPTEEG